MKTTLVTAALAALMLACGGPELDGEGAFDAASGAGVNDATHTVADALAAKATTTTTTTKKTPVSKHASIAASYATQTTDAHEAGTAPTWKQRYAVIDTWSVEIASDVPSSITGHHTLDVYVYSPSGSVYQHFTQPFASGSAIAGDGEAQAEPTASGFRVWVSLPVKGSFIDSYNLVGGWRADSYLDGVGVKSSAAFQLE